MIRTTLATLAMLAVVLLATGASAEPHPSGPARSNGTPAPARLRITARLYGTSEASERTLPSAMREAVKILASAGVDLAVQRCERWRSGDEDDPCAHPLEPTDIAVRTYRSSPASGDSAEQRLGYSFIDWSTGRGSLVTIDLTSHLRLADYAELYATCSNLFDEQVIVSRRPYGARPNPPRMIALGYKARF